MASTNVGHARSFSAHVERECTVRANDKLGKSTWPANLLHMPWRYAFMRQRKQSPPGAGARQSMAVVLRGELRAVGGSSEPTNCAASVRTHLLEPAAAADVAADVLIVTYESHALASVQALYEPWLTVVALLPRNGSHQVPSAAAALRVLSHASPSSGASAYDAVLLTRLDVVLKSDLHAVLTNARVLGRNAAPVGLRFVWREAPSDFRRSAKLAAIFGDGHWSLSAGLSAGRVGDVMHAFSSCVLRCFLSAMWSDAQLHNLHNIRVKVTSAISGAVARASRSITDGARADAESTNGTVGYLLDDGAYDSKPCRGVCRPNPLYALQHNEPHLAASGICQHAHQFEHDPISATRCCATPDSCCPLSVMRCSDPAARLFDAPVLGSDSRPAPWVWALAQHPERQLCPAQSWDSGAAKATVTQTAGRATCGLALGNSTHAELRALCESVRGAHNGTGWAWVCPSGWRPAATPRAGRDWKQECGAQWRKFCEGSAPVGVA